MSEWKTVRCPNCHHVFEVIKRATETECPDCCKIFDIRKSDEVATDCLDKLMAGAGAGSIVEEE